MKDHGEMAMNGGNVPDREETITIRNAAPGDAAALAELSRQLGYPTSAERSASRLAAILPSDGHAVLVACLGDGTVAGWAHVFEALRVESDPFAELGGLVVAEGRRGRGIGRRMVEAAGVWAARRGLASLRVRSRSSRADARVFYERMGFHLTKEQNVFHKTLG